jgi:membrane protease YdiL (CAAX protease family)
MRVLRDHPLAGYFVLAYLFSWAIGVPLALSVHGQLPLALPLRLHYLTAYGPALAALVVTGVTGGAPALRALWTRLTTTRGIGVWLLVAALSPIALFAAARMALALAGRAVAPWSGLGQVNFLPNLGLGAWLLWLFNSGLGEEVGWRGFALPHLQRSRPALMASLWLGLLWAGWHLPAFFYLPNYAAMGLKVFPGFAFGVVAGAVLLTWLYNSTAGSILAAALWHASFNFVTASAAGTGTVAALTSVAVIVWAAVVWYWYGGRSLAAPPRQVA